MITNKRKNKQIHSRPFKKTLIYSSILLSILSGCSGSVSFHDNNTTTSVNYEINVADGYVENASVCIDTDFDFICDTNSANTDEKGSTSIKVDRKKTESDQYVVIAKIPKNSVTYLPDDEKSYILRDNLMIAYLCPGDESTKIQLSSFTTLAAIKDADNCENYEESINTYSKNLSIDIKNDFNQSNNKALIVNNMLEQTGKLPESIELFKSYKKNRIDRNIKNYTQAASKVLDLDNATTSDKISAAKAIIGYSESMQDLILEGRKVAFPNSLEWIKNNYFYWDHLISDEENINNIVNYISIFSANYTASTANENISGRDEYKTKVVDYQLNLNKSKVSDKKVVIVLGLPAAGKSTAITPLTDGIVTDRSIELDTDGKGTYVLVDPDEAKNFLPEYDNGLLSDIVHRESSQISKELLQKALAEETNICYPTTGSGSDYMEDFYKKKIKPFNEVGYNIIVGFADIPLEISKKRNLNRIKIKGRYVSNATIEKMGTTPGDNFCKLINDKDNNSNISKFVWFDTSESTPKILIEGNPSNEDDVEKVKTLCTEKGYSYAIE